VNATPWPALFIRPFNPFNEKDLAMSDKSHACLRTFLVDIRFFSGDEQFAVETYTIDASNWYRAEQHALQLSGNSVYDDPRIPDLARSATARDIS
jgi:hypothetical protein